MRIRRVGDRLRAAFRGVVESFPPNARNISGMARWLNVHKATCQRIVEGLDAGRDGLSCFARFPGTEGMRLHLAAARDHGVLLDAVEAASAAVDEYEALLGVYGHTQRGLVRIIESLRVEFAGPKGQPDRELAEDQRKALYDGARRVTGEEIRAKTLVAIIRPRADQPARLDASFYTRLVGAKRHAFSRPIVSSILAGWWAHLHSAEVPDANRPANVPPEYPPFSLIREFSTAGAKPVKIGQADSKTLVVVDLENVPSDGDGLGPADIAVVFRSVAVPSPLWTSSGRMNVAMRFNYPCRTMLMDVFLHHTLAASVAPNIASYSVTATPGDMPDGGPDHCWHERFPDAPELITLGRNEPRPRAHMPRHDEFIDHAFAHEGANPADYVGYRCEVAYPIWQSEYRLYFEVPRPDSGAEVLPESSDK